MSKKLRRKTTSKKARHSKRRKNPAGSCPSCGTGNKPGRGTCWKCGFELVATAKPVFGRALRTKTKRKAAKRKANRKGRKRAK